MPTPRSFHLRILLLAAPALALTLLSVATAARVPTTRRDFLQPGTQPNTIRVNVFESVSCEFCHGFYDDNAAPHTNWVNSMMAQSARDPVFYAALSIGNQDAAFVGEICLRCHAPIAWLEGRSQPEDGSAFIPKDFDGVTCHVCHRMVDPVFSKGNPPRDQDILKALGSNLPRDPHNAQMVIEPEDFRRGPYDLGPDFFYHDWAQSPHHRESAICGVCHDVSNPAYTRQPDGTYALGPIDEPHPTHDSLDSFPEQRTYTEWTLSEFAQGPVNVGGRFGGTMSAVSTCQDCHMPQVTGTACAPGLDPPIRTDMKRHQFLGANTWVLRAVYSLYGSSSNLTPALVEEGIARNIAFLRQASDLQLSQQFNRITARVINQTGHKLPTGYVEGRRMWVNARFLDPQGAVVREFGRYDLDSATLFAAGTKVYEAKAGIDAEIARLTGIPEGPTFHLALNNKFYKDNRIPPRGFTNAAFAAAYIPPVDYAYADGQYWDDTVYSIPPRAVRAEVRVYYQTSSREYIEFLRDANTTDNRGQIAYQQWVLHGRSEPVQMDFAVLQLQIPGDLNNDGRVDQADLGLLLSAWQVGDGGDIDGDGDTDQADLGFLLANWSLAR